MRRLHSLLSGVASLFRRSRLERDMDAELRFHLEARADDLIRGGLSRPEAERRARLEFGGVANYKDQIREAFGVRIVDDLGRDLAYAWRSLRRTPAFAITAIGAIALGVAVNASLFSLVYALLLRPLPVKDPSTIRNVFMETRGDGSRGTHGTPSVVSFAEFNFMRAHARTAELAAISEAELGCKCSADGTIAAQLVSDNLLPLIGATPAAGRFFTREETATPGSDAVAVLSWTAWKNKFSGDAAIVGRSVTMNRTPFTIIGVADERTTGPLLMKPDVWIPYTMQALTREGDPFIRDPNMGWIQILARRRPDASDATMRAELQVLGQQALTAHGSKQTAVVSMAPGAFLNDPTITRDGWAPAALLFLAVTFVLLIACANVANMLLARGFARRREIAIRLSIGAGRRRLFQQFLTESALLGVLGGTLGLTLSQLAVRLVVASIPASDIGPHQMNLSADWRIMLYTLVVSLLASLVFGIVPALRLLRDDLAPSLKTDTLEPAPARRRVPLQSLLVAGQAGLCLLLLVNAGLLLRGFDRGLRMDRGLATDHVLIGAFDLRQQQYTPERARQLLEDLRERAAAMPGVDAASLTTNIPFVSQSFDAAKTIDANGAPGQQFGVADEMVGADFFQAMRIDTLRGRGISRADLQTGVRVAVVDDRLARTYYGGLDAVGRRINPGGGRENDCVIVGVVSATHPISFNRAERPMMYLPMRGLDYVSGKLLVHYRGAPEAIVAALRQGASELDPNVTVTVMPIERNVTSAMAPVQTAAAAVSTLGVLALVLACSGLYGVVAFTVGRRRREIGIRVALGADRARILRMVVGQGLRPMLVGAAIGLVLAAASGQLLRAMLFGVSPIDPVTFTATGALLTAAAAIAAFVPARAALQIDPAEALRHD
jgi:predicted permease